MFGSYYCVLVKNNMRERERERERDRERSGSDYVAALDFI